MSVCVDASLALKWVTCETGSDKAIAWLEAHAGDELVAPALLGVETASVLRRKVSRDEMTAEEALQALRLLTRLRIRLVWDWALATRAFELATDLDLPAAYDAVYLAVAEGERCELWTADRRFADAASARYPFVRVL